MLSENKESDQEHLLPRILQQFGDDFVYYLPNRVAGHKARVTTKSFKFQNMDGWRVNFPILWEIVVSFQATPRKMEHLLMVKEILTRTGN